MKALPFAYQKDKKVHELESNKYEYLYEEEILVAPIYYGGNYKKVYLPKGQWIDWWTGEEYEGNQEIEYIASLKRIPLFIKKGSIIPLLPTGIETILPVDNKNIKNKVDKLIYEIYPAEEATFSLEEGQTIEVKKIRNQIKIKINNPRLKKIELNIIDGLEKEIKSFSGCDIIDIGKAYPAVSGVDSDKVEHEGFKIIIAPKEEDIKIKLESEEK